MKDLLTLPKKVQKEHLNSPYCYYKTPAGTLKLLFKNKQLCEAFFIKESEIVENIPNLTGQKINALHLYGTPFQIKVWRSIMQLNQITTYQEIAQKIGHPKAHRAVANALGQNKIAYFVPCHKVIRKDGSLGGYKWGIERKKKLLALQ